MTELIDIAGLIEISSVFRRGASEIAAARTDGAAELAKLDQWSERSRFHGLLETQEAWALTMADDLAFRAEGMTASEATAQALAAAGLSDDPTKGIHHDAGRSVDKRSPEVRDALSRIEELLRTDGWNFRLFSIGDTDVSDDDLADIMRILVGLAPATLRSVLEGMDDSLLARWFAETSERDVNPALHRQLFDHIAGDLSAPQLSRLLLLAAGTTRARLLESIGTQAGGFKQRLVFRSVLDRMGEEGYAGVTTALLALMSPAARQQALLRLDGRGQLDTFIGSLLLVEDRVDVAYLSRTATVSYLYDGSALADLVALLATVSSPDLKAAVFVAAVAALEGPLADASDLLQVGLGVITTHRFANDTGEAALAALVALLITDPANIFDALRLGTDFYGWSMSDFLRELLRAPGARSDSRGEPLSHDGAILANEILASLVGADLDQDSRAAFFQATERAVGGLEDYVNASRLGYFAGTLSRALDDLGMSVDDEWIAAGIVLGGVGLIDPTKVTAAVELIETIVKEISSEIQDRTVVQLQQEYGQLEQMILEQILPREGRYFYDGDAADEFLVTYDRVGGIVVGPPEAPPGLEQ